MVGDLPARCSTRCHRGKRSAGAPTLHRGHGVHDMGTTVPRARNRFVAPGLLARTHHDHHSAPGALKREAIERSPRRHPDHGSGPWRRRHRGHNRDPKGACEGGSTGISCAETRHLDLPHACPGSFPHWRTPRSMEGPVPPRGVGGAHHGLFLSLRLRRRLPTAQRERQGPRCCKPEPFAPHRPLLCLARGTHETAGIPRGIVSGMLAPVQIRLCLALVVLAGAGLREHRRSGAIPVVLLPADSLPAAPLLPEARTLEPDFGMRMTPDDVARGTWALARGEGPGLTPEQATRLLPAARRARVARADVDRHRARQRQARTTARTAGAVLAGALVDLGWTPGTERLP